MQALLFADRKPFGSDPISQQYCPALLPLGGRETLIHSIEDLASAGVEKLFLVISTQAHQIELRLGDGSRWGVEIEYLLSRGEEKPSLIINRYRDRLSKVQLLVRSDMLRSACIGEMLKEIDPRANNVSLYFDGMPAGVVFCRSNLREDVVDLIDWPQLRAATPHSVSRLDLAGYSRSLLDGLSEFYEAALAIACNRFLNIEPRGLKAATGIVHGRNSRLHDSLQVEGIALAGDNVFVGRGVLLRGPVVITDDVFIDRSARLSNCVVMPGTYVGEGVNLENCILSRDHVHRMDMDVGLAITDDFIASKLELPDKLLLDRVLASLLLLASAPLWLCAGLMAVIGSPRQLFRRVQINSNRAPALDPRAADRMRVEALEWNVAVPLFKRLPWLLKVIRGDLRLIGADPLEPSRVDDEVARHLSKSAYGLLSVSQVDLEKNVPPLERSFNDFVYDRQRSAASDIRYLVAFLRRLFQAESWRADVTV